MTRDLGARAEPVGPVSLFMPIGSLDDAIAAANRLPFGCAADAFAHSGRTVAALGERIGSGMITINHSGPALAETPFGATEAVESSPSPKFITERPI